LNKKGVAILLISFLVLLIAGGFLTVKWTMFSRKTGNVERENTKEVNATSVAGKDVDDLSTNQPERSISRSDRNTNDTPVTGEEDPELKEIVLFSGSQTGSDVVDTIPTGSNLDMTNVVSEGYFYAVYKADKMRDVKLVFAEWDKNWWKVIFELNKTYAFDNVKFSDWLMALRKEILNNTLKKIESEVK